jgi:hypothetical protein
MENNILNMLFNTIIMHFYLKIQEKLNKDKIYLKLFYLFMNFIMEKIIKLLKIL